MNDVDVETDRRCLEAVAQTLRVSPGSVICPDIDRLAATDRPLEEKIVIFRERLIRNIRRQTKHDGVRNGRV